MNGSVSQAGTYKRTGKPRWVARYRGPDRVERQRAFRTKTEAQAWLNERKAEMTLGDWIAPELGRRTFESLAEEWLELHTGKPSTIAGYRSVLRKHLYPRFGKQKVNTITGPQVSKLVAEIVASGARPNTATNVLNVAKGVMRHGVAAGALRTSPVAGLAAPKSHKREMEFASAAEVAAIADRVGEHSTLIFTAAYTGLRAGELYALRIGDLDFLRGRIHVRRAQTEVSGRIEVGTPKSGRERTVSIPPFLRDMLTAHVARVAVEPDALVFSNPDGSPLRQSNFYPRVFRPAADDIGRTVLRFHDLRHTCAAFLIDAGAHPRAIMERLGHSSITVTMDTYGHLLPSLDDDLTTALESRFRSAS
ncbi:MAG: site-specific integrase [Acidobacteriota bacterium]